MKFLFNPIVSKETKDKAKKAVRKVKQTTFCYCECGNELISNNCCVRDVYLFNRNVVHFICDKCGKNTYYDFDFPAPVELPMYEDDDIIDRYNNTDFSQIAEASADF